MLPTWRLADCNHNDVSYFLYIYGTRMARFNLHFLVFFIEEKRGTDMQRTKLVHFPQAGLLGDPVSSYHPSATTTFIPVGNHSSTYCFSSGRIPIYASPIYTLCVCVRARVCVCVCMHRYLMLLLHVVTTLPG